MSSQQKTHNLGYPRIGERRELKKATEAYWQGKLSQDELKAVGKQLRQTNWEKQRDAGIDLIPCNDFSFYDQMLDMSCLLGNIPERFQGEHSNDTFDLQFKIARGVQETKDKSSPCSPSGFASEMTKWFDTNYHFIVPEFTKESTFQVLSTKVFDEFAEAKALGINAKPVLIGPLTYLTLGKVQDAKNPDFNRFELIDKLLPVYETVLARLAEEGAEWVQIDEPVLALDLSNEQRAILKESYARLANASGAAKLIVASYFGELRENLADFLALPVDGLHFDADRGYAEIDSVLANFPKDKILSLGVVDGRNIWINDFSRSLQILNKATTTVGPESLWVAPSCSLLHTPITLKNEPKLDTELTSWLAFANEKLDEIASLRNLLVDSDSNQDKLAKNISAHQSHSNSKRIHNPEVAQRLAAVKDPDYERDSTFAARQKAQQEKLDLPLFPTTTIGSFPQTKAVRSARARFKKGELNAEQYDQFLKEETKRCVEFQDNIGIDMPVHGEFERNDMVEFFGEQLDGFTFTKNGWVQSYGSRYVKPPVIFGDVSRPSAMTTYWSEYAQSLTKRPMKGMLTGPITILQWSFVRNDQPRELTTRQIALAIRDEVADLERIGIAAIQIDEPAIREGLPLRRSDWAAYLDWAVKAFRLSSCCVRDDTQIHTHMCYSEFNDIIDSIAALDADVITIETSRSNMELLDAFVGFQYPNEIGPGIYDIHSPRIPGIQEMEKLMHKASALLPIRNLWVNPDCGLKTRNWAEVEPALRNMVACAESLRENATVESAEMATTT
ncbi:5-methyltetrahydropteroyltriglutamate--homocysteine S-methyltransferase [Rubellicoccus peritrichatus]|uniref:5-methyltetrahydropteroyltriglutamate--homocysteine methyltransferase n=1 Tax=Rubellicoccus peritrichatus TaxID=3080537 RepID=A0AAQ3L7P9_9BACT|nr:5-methyltetrahydropteroyltriglutamate--homocysteine S-methyltransferase [Puniceicoccus sp. CR14]WOO41159.1 5-methyltetrahydropteroyltriglutamate--homocysteine S-methyltransferase [Puniceicoccus sp. CR14]